ncbi:MAG: phage major capsid protein, partial [Nitrospinae bacterium]|nr:phage major capsid protein [Nitrospinota bacterium]
AFWASEADTASKSKPKFRLMNLKLKKLIGLVYATDELLADSTALESVMQRAFAEEFGFKVDDAIINGDGAGKPKGILNSDALVTVAKEIGQLANTIVAENIVNMYSRMPASSLRTGEWYINQAVWPQLSMLNVIGGTASTPVFLPPGGLSSAPFGTIMGRPINPIEHCAALGTVGDIIFADLDQYVFIEKGGIKADQSIHVQFLTDEMAFRFIMRVDGQPIQNAALTPFKGTDTISPFVALATRA